MASAKTIEIVKSTAAVLEQHGEAITTVFYKRLFEKHPEMKGIFNMTHQKQGTQPKVLANAIFQYAQHIDKLALLGDAVESIAQKHSSLSITPEMYPIVGENLLAAIKEVLGDAATPEIIGAWAEAYGDLAVIFVNREEELYSTREQLKGGFRGKKEFVVAQKVEESEVITSFYLQPKDGSAVPSFEHGQYIALTVDIPNTSHQHTRNYSLSDCNCKDYLRISVKKEHLDPEGIVSNHLHDNIKEGDSLNIGMPAGEFVLKNSDKPVVLIAGGVGITPLMSMYKNLVNSSDRKVLFVQCALNSAAHAFRKEIKSNLNANAKSVVVYDQPLDTDELGVNYDFEGFLATQMLNELGVAKDADFYFCGPKLFMANVLAVLKDLDIKEEQINYEFFGPTQELVSETV